MENLLKFDRINHGYYYLSMAEDLDENDEQLTLAATDSLKLETSNISPKESAEILEIGHIFRTRLEEHYGKYMAPDKLEEMKEFKPEERILVMGKEDFEVFARDWNGETREDGSESRFSESGARYYADMLLDECGLDKPVTKNEIRITMFYLEQIFKYGDDIHKLYFGGQVDEARKKEILSEFDRSPITELLANYEQNQTEDSLDEDIYGMNFPGDFMSLKNPTEIWQRVYEEKKKVMIEKYGSEEEAIKNLDSAFRNMFIAHELVHYYEPEWLNNP